MEDNSNNKNSRSTFVFLDYLSLDLGPQLSLVGPEKVSIDTPFSPSIDTTNELSIDEPSRDRYHTDREPSFRLRPNIYWQGPS
ncbi:hypothetical protein IGI04_026092 [Brassica rapa subsp. trilocularis]|uniref:Uncharacterized protein n=1 Tax=Brassica rapa subsp. trilocularis TaxID=1813537 RepID=A0ABQ7KXQ2_BRACM|nr:hypothetical protein IGI04_026092 [Brassica rapa subsp. trilocularis]